MFYLFITMLLCIFVYTSFSQQGGIKIFMLSEFPELQSLLFMPCFSSREGLLHGRREGREVLGGDGEGRRVGEGNYF